MVVTYNLCIGGQRIYVSTAALLKGKQIITAGHNFFSYEQAQKNEKEREYAPYPQKVEFYLGKNDDTHIRKYKVRKRHIHIHGDYIKKGTSDLAVASLKLIEGKENKVFKFSILFPKGEMIKALRTQIQKVPSFNLTGYPGEKVDSQSSTWFGKLYGMDGRIPYIIEEKRLALYTMHATQGQSGSPIWQEFKDKAYIFAIHTNGHNCIKLDSNDTIYNVGQDLLGYGNFLRKHLKYIQ